MTPASQEQLLSKTAVEKVFSFSKKEWAEQASRMVVRDQELRTSEFDTGNIVAIYNPSTGIGVSIQPFFRNEHGQPNIVKISNYFPRGLLPPMTKNLREDIELAARTEIGSAYSLTLTHSVEDKQEVITFFITVMS